MKDLRAQTGEDEIDALGGDPCRLAHIARRIAEALRHILGKAFYRDVEVDGIPRCDAALAADAEGESRAEPRLHAGAHRHRVPVIAARGVANAAFEEPLQKKRRIARRAAAG